MLVVNDLEDPFVPIADDLLVNLQESKEVVKNLLTKLPKMFTTTQNTENCLGAALKVAFQISVRTFFFPAISSHQFPLFFSPFCSPLLFPILLGENWRKDFDFQQLDSEHWTWKIEIVER
jgi:hypothetical protein